MGKLRRRRIVAVKSPRALVGCLSVLVMPPVIVFCNDVWHVEIPLMCE